MNVRRKTRSRDSILLKVGDQEVRFVRQEQSYNATFSGLELLVDITEYDELGSTLTGELFHRAISELDELKVRFARFENNPGESLLQHVNLHPCEAHPEPLSLQAFVNNLTERDIAIYDDDDNNFTGDPGQNHVVHIGIDNGYMFGDGWSQIHLTLDFAGFLVT